MFRNVKTASSAVLHFLSFSLWRRDRLGGYCLFLPACPRPRLDADYNFVIGPGIASISWSGAIPSCPPPSRSGRTGRSRHRWSKTCLRWEGIEHAGPRHREAKPCEVHPRPGRDGDRRWLRRFQRTDPRDRRGGQSADAGVQQKMTLPRRDDRSRRDSDFADGNGASILRIAEATTIHRPHPTSVRRGDVSGERRDAPWATC